MEITNFTGTLDLAAAFVRAKAALIDTTGVSLHIKYTRAKGRDLNGYYRLDDRRIVVSVKRRLRYPRDAAYGVGTAPVAKPTPGKRPYRLIWHEETFRSPDDLLVFAAGHEFWHFLCHSGQRRGDFETKANCNGFAWLGEFQRWAGPGAPVEAIPLRPPRPDLADSATHEASPTTLPVAARAGSGVANGLANGLANAEANGLANGFGHGIGDAGEESLTSLADAAKTAPHRPRPTSEPRRGEQLSLFEFTA